jgi:hypothetical protein
MQILKPFFFTILLLTITLVFSISSCKKWKDSIATDDPRLHGRKYCNDPEAVNYNWGFPGVPDNSICVFPSDLYKGTYTYTDSIYNSNDVFDSLLSKQTYTIQVIVLSKKRIAIIGFCSNDTLFFTAGRTTYSASADSTLKLNDSTIAFGQPMCRILDTLSGTITKNSLDTTNTKIKFNWTVVSDTSTNYHRGTAVKQ